MNETEHYSFNKVCPACRCMLPVESFNLKRGKHSAERKPICTKCEYAQRIDKKTGLANGVRHKLLKAPCSICNKSAFHIDVDADGLPIGVLCKDCRPLVIAELNPNYRKAIDNYVMMRKEFPVVGKVLLSYYIDGGEIGSKPSFPLLEFIDGKANSP